MFCTLIKYIKNIILQVNLKKNHTYIFIFFVLLNAFKLDKSI